MYIITLIIFFAISLLLMLAIYYFLTLVMSKNDYTKDDLTGFRNFLKNIVPSLADDSSHITIFSVFTSASVLGVLLTQLFTSWIINSIIPIGLLYLLFYFLRKTYLERYAFNEGSFKSNIVNIFLIQNSLFLTCFSIGVLSSITYNQLSTANTQPLFFVLDASAIMAFIFYQMKALFAKEKKISLKKDESLK